MYSNKIYFGADMNEIIASILDAEKKAEEIVKNSNEKAKGIRQSADEEGEKIKNSAIAVFKLKRNAALAEAEKHAQQEYDDMVVKGKNLSEEIVKNSADMIDDCVENIVKDITG